MSALAVVLWLWLLVSLSIYGYRIYRRVTQGPKSERQGDAMTEDATKSDRPAGAATELIQNPVAGFEDAPTRLDVPTGPAPDHVEIAPMDPGRPDSTRVPEHGSAAMPGPGVAASATPAPAPGFASAPDTSLAPAATPASERRSPRKPVGDALAGVQLPCDLSPLIGETTRLDPFDLAFSTSTHDGDHVRGGLAAELIRLGYQVAPTSPYRLTASRAGADLVVTIYPDPSRATEAGRPLYPSAASDSVVVRFQS